jgi:transaldolase
MTRLTRLYEEQGQSPWLDNLSRDDLRSGALARLIAAGVRGVTANPTIVARAIEGSDAYDEQLESLVSRGRSAEDAYWDLAVADVREALTLLRPTFDSARGDDGFVSIEVAPADARNTAATIEAARRLHERIDRPNLLVKIPATSQGIPAIEAMVGEGRSINVTLIFSLARYRQVLEAYLSGLESWADRGGDLSAVHSVASFFVSRVDSEVDRRLESLAVDAALDLRGRAAVAQAKVAYQMFRHAHSGERWDRLAALGARVQRPLWASTSTKNPGYPDTLYVDSLIGPDTVNTLPQATLDAFEDHGTVARSIDRDLPDAEECLRDLAAVGIDMEAVGDKLETEGVAAFDASFKGVLEVLAGKSRGERPRSA